MAWRLLKHVQVERKWRQHRAKVQKQWGTLTDQRIAQTNGKRDELVTKIPQELYRVSAEEAQRQVDEWERGIFRMRGFSRSE